MPMPLFILPDSLIINQPCNYSVEWRENKRGKDRDSGNTEREILKKILCESIVQEQGKSKEEREKLSDER